MSTNSIHDFNFFWAKNRKLDKKQSNKLVTYDLKNRADFINFLLVNANFLISCRISGYIRPPTMVANIQGKKKLQRLVVGQYLGKKKLL